MPSTPDFNKIKDSISNGLEKISNKSEDFLEISKIKYKIHSEENNMENLYRDLGRELYTIFKSSHYIDDSLLDYFTALKKVENRIKSLEKKLHKPDDKK